MINCGETGGACAGNGAGDTGAGNEPRALVPAVRPGALLPAIRLTVRRVACRKSEHWDVQATIILRQPKRWLYMVDIDGRFLRPCRVLDPPDAARPKTHDNLGITRRYSLIS